MGAEAVPIPGGVYLRSVRWYDNRYSLPKYRTKPHSARLWLSGCEPHLPFAIDAFRSGSALVTHRTNRRN